MSNNTIIIHGDQDILDEELFYCKHCNAHRKRAHFSKQCGNREHSSLFEEGKTLLEFSNIEFEKRQIPNLYNE